MPLPLLGLLALGGAEAFGPGLMNRRKRIAGDYYQDVTAGVDPNDPNAMRSALGAGGLLSGSEVQGDLRQGFEGLAGRQQSDLNSRRSAGSAANRLAFDREMFVTQEAQKMQERADLKAYNEHLVNTYGTDAERAITDNEFTPGFVRKAVTDSIIGRETALPYDANTDADLQRQLIVQRERLDAERLNKEAEAQAKLGVEQKAKTEEFAGERQALVTSQDAMDESLRVLDDANVGKKFWGSKQGNEATQYINKSLQMLRSDFWRNELGRTDAPTQSEIEGLLKIIPEISGDMMENNAQLRNTVRYTLQLANEQIDRRGSILRNQFEGNTQPMSWGAGESAGRGWRE